MFNPANPLEIIEEYCDVNYNLPIEEFNKNGRITDSLATILSNKFETSKEYWLNIQSQYDEWVSKKTKPL